MAQQADQALTTPAPQASPDLQFHQFRQRSRGAGSQVLLADSPVEVNCQALQSDGQVLRPATACRGLDRFDDPEPTCRQFSDHAAFTVGWSARIPDGLNYTTAMEVTGSTGQQFKDGVQPFLLAPGKDPQEVAFIGQRSRGHVAIQRLPRAGQFQ